MSSVKIIATAPMRGNSFSCYTTSMKKTKKAIEILRSGGVIAFPTETVFGIGALLSQKKAIRKIYKLKNRPLNKPLQVLVADIEQAKRLGKFSKKELELAKSSWPGPLTLVVYKKRIIPKIVTGGGKTVGLRIPDHKIILELLKKCGPIAATSANRSDKKPALNAKAVKKALPEIDYILPGKVKTGKASQVIDATRNYITLRS